MNDIILSYIILFQVVDGVCIIYKFWPSVHLSSAMGVALVSIQFFIPLLILAYCYGKILWMLSRRINSNLTQTSVEDKFEVARKNTIKTFLLVGIFFVICWSSNQVNFLLFTLGRPTDWDTAFYKFTLLMIFLNCTVNPFIYLFEYRDYQQALKSCLGCKKQRDENESTSKRGNTSTSSISNNYI